LETTFRRVIGSDRSCLSRRCAGFVLKKRKCSPASSIEKFATGTPITNERGFGFRNHDFSLVKDTRIGESLNLQLRFEFFNFRNRHTFTGFSMYGGLPFINSYGTPDFGLWNGTVRRPRIIQLGARLEF